MSIRALLGEGDPSCRVLAADISVHWFADAAQNCLCGQTHRELAPECEHDWMDLGGPGDEWRRCFLCGQEDDA